MIKEIIDHEVQPTPQMGEIVLFARRKESESNIINIQSMEKLFDHIRMLDCDGYPLSYFETEYFRFEFSNAEHDITKNTILANVRIIKK
jgi:methionyl-tRNA formyltransferase